MKTKTNLKAGAFDAFRNPRPAPNHNQTLVRDAGPVGVRVQTTLKAGLFDVFRTPRPAPNHNQTLVREATRSGLETRTGIKAGVGPQSDFPHKPPRDRG